MVLPTFARNVMATAALLHFGTNAAAHLVELFGDGRAAQVERPSDDEEGADAGTSRPVPCSE